MFEILRYVTASGDDVFGTWLSQLRDNKAKAKILVRLDRLQIGNFGDCKPLRDGVWELRIDWGPGYRVYYAMISRRQILLLNAGDKRKQASDIEKAVKWWQDFKRRTRKP